MADLDNDNDYEIIYVSWYVVGALHHTGTSHLWTFNASSGSFRGCAVADIDGNDTLDVALGCDDGYLQTIRGNNGQLLWEINLASHYGQEYEIDHAPTIADFDGDGKLDIFVTGGHFESANPQNNHGRAYALSAGDGTGPGWPMFRHDLRHSACFDGPLGITEDEVPVDGSTDRPFIQCFPNPFSHAAIISFHLTRSEQVTLKIYDITGSLVQILIDGVGQKGKNTVQWDRRDESGSVVPAGIYFCTMETSSATKTIKIMKIN
jgi:hypothetical protein